MHDLREGSEPHPADNTQNMKTKGFYDLIDYFIGGKEEFSFEHRFLNFSGLLLFIASFSTTFFNFFVRFSLLTIFVGAAGLLVSLIIYYFSRLKMKFWFPLWVLYFFSLSTLCLLWFYNAGSEGPAIYYFIVLLTLFLFLLNGFERIVVLTGSFTVISILYVSEYYYHDVIRHYSDEQEKFVDTFIGISAAFLLIICIIFYAKKNYSNQKHVNERLKEKLEREHADRRKTEELLVRQANFITSIFEASPEALFITDMEGKMIQLNAAASRLFRVSDPIAAAGLTVTSMMTKENAEKFSIHFRQTAESGKIVKDEYSFTGERGEDLRYIISLNVIMDENDKPAFITGLSSDITERVIAEKQLAGFNQRLEKMLGERTSELEAELRVRKKAEFDLMAKHNILKSVLESVPEAIAITDLNGFITDCNAEALQLFGAMDRDGIIGKNYYKLIGGQRASELSFLLRKEPENGSENAVEFIYERNGNDSLTLELKLGLVRDSFNLPLFHVIVAKDISLIKSNEESLKNQSEKLQQLNATKDKFFSIIAHDLKDPFNAIIGFADLLHREYDEFSDEERRQFVKNIKKSAENIFKLLQNLLEWSRAQSGSIEFRPQQLHFKPLVGEIAGLLKTQADNKNVEISTDNQNDFTLYADPNMLRTIIRNLVSNAIKFTPEGGRIRISGKADISDSKMSIAEIVISDTGVGIDNENLDKLFRIDKKLKTRGTAMEEGTGLGLILCKELIERHNGNIRVESEPGVGSRFIVTLPLNGI